MALNLQRLYRWLGLVCPGLKRLLPEGVVGDSWMVCDVLLTTSCSYRVDYGRRNKTAFRIQVEKGEAHKGWDLMFFWTVVLIYSFETCVKAAKVQIPDRWTSGTSAVMKMCESNGSFSCGFEVYEAVKEASELSNIEKKHLAKRARSIQREG